MSEKPDPRVEIMASAIASPLGVTWSDEEDARRMLAALESAGWRIVKLEQAGWRNPDFTEPEDCPVGMAREPKEEWEGWTVPVYRVIEEGPA